MPPKQKPFALPAKPPVKHEPLAAHAVLPAGFIEVNNSSAVRAYRVVSDPGGLFGELQLIFPARKDGTCQRCHYERVDATVIRLFILSESKGTFLSRVLKVGRSFYYADFETGHRLEVEP